MALKKSYGCMAALATLSAAFCLASASAQVVPAGYEPAHSIWVGAEYSNFGASFPYQSHQRLQGAGVFCDYHIGHWLWLEGEANFLPFGGFADSTESSYLAGPRVTGFRRKKLQPFVKPLVGVGVIHYPYVIGDAHYFAFAPAGGLDYRLRDRWMVRVDYEYQFWPRSPGYADVPSHELTPNGFHLGVAYRIFR
jgi:opacity protein-like surface antigen